MQESWSNFPLDRCLYFTEVPVGSSWPPKTYMKIINAFLVVNVHIKNRIISRATEVRLQIEKNEMPFGFVAEFNGTDAVKFLSEPKFTTHLNLFLFPLFHQGIHIRHHRNTIKDLEADKILHNSKVLVEAKALILAQLAEVEEEVITSIKNLKYFCKLIFNKAVYKKSIKQ